MCQHIKGKDTNVTLLETWQNTTQGSIQISYTNLKHVHLKQRMSNVWRQKSKQTCYDRDLYKKD